MTSSAKILILDDRDIIADMYYIVLIEILAEYKIYFSKNAIQICRSYDEFCNMDDKTFDVAFIDWNLDKGHTGREVIEALTCKHIAVISGSKEGAEYCKERGIRFIEKPPCQQDFKDFIAEIFGGGPREFF